jgi:hypothetical protein
MALGLTFIGAKMPHQANLHQEAVHDSAFYPVNLI